MMPSITENALPQSEWAAQTQVRRGWFGRAALVLQLGVALLVSLSVFRGLMLQGGEEDAQHALRWIAAEINRSHLPANADLASWLATQEVLQHRLGDARSHGTEMHYHGYRFGWTPRSTGGGILWAQPLRLGITGRVPFEIVLAAPEGASAREARAPAPSAP